MVFYYITLAILLVAYALIAIFVLDRLKNTKIANLIFCLVTVICYLGVVIIALIQNGWSDWNFLNTLPTANVSPFMFFICPIYLLLPKKPKDYFLNLIVLLSIGMIVSPVFGIVYNIYRDYAFHGQFVLDYVAHVSLSLWGLYIVKSHQIELNVKDSLISGSLIVGVALTMLIINLIFDTSFFGLSLRGKHNIYNVVLVENSFLSCLIYFGGLLAILLVGYLFNRYLVYKKKDA